jgi:hypothetical protein
VTTSPLFVSVADWSFGFTKQARLVDRFGTVVWRCTHRHRMVEMARDCAQTEYVSRSKAKARAS